VNLVAEVTHAYVKTFSLQQDIVCKINRGHQTNFLDLSLYLIVCFSLPVTRLCSASCCSPRCPDISNCDKGTFMWQLSTQQETSDSPIIVIGQMISRLPMARLRMHCSMQHADAFEFCARVPYALVPLQQAHLELVSRDACSNCICLGRQCKQHDRSRL
jgi:hypothetical protein